MDRCAYLKVSRRWPLVSWENVVSGRHWRCIRSVSELTHVQYDQLIQRAEDQHRRVDVLRLDAAKAVLVTIDEVNRASGIG